MTAKQTVYRSVIFNISSRDYKDINVGFLFYVGVQSPSQK